MICPECNDYVEITKEGNGDYEYWCECGVHGIIELTTSVKNSERG